jgi:hypothetical protein
MVVVVIDEVEEIMTALALVEDEADPVVADL